MYSYQNPFYTLYMWASHVTLTGCAVAQYNPNRYSYSTSMLFFWGNYPCNNENVGSFMILEKTGKLGLLR
jgi:hypothetical protein